MTLLETISGDLKQAMLNREELRVSVLRMLVTSLKNKSIEMGGVHIQLSDDDCIAVIKTEVKKRKDSIEAYEKGDRQELADKEREEILVLEKYMPEQMGEEQIELIVQEVIGSMGEVGMGDFGRVMGQVMGKTKGQADGTQVSAVVKRLLSK